MDLIRHGGMPANCIRATYTNMDPGKYTFRVKACNKDGIWNETGASLSIRVLPPWWWSWWAFALYAGLIATGLYTGLRFERRRHAERSEALRMAELDAVKTRLYTNITHEFRTPLTVISGMADLVEQPAEARDLIKRNAASLLHLVNQILDLARLEAGRLSLDLVLTDIVPFLRTLTDSFRTYAEVQGTDLIFYSESTSLTMDMDTQKMFSIGSNLLSNAIKFSETSGQILVHLREEPGVMVLKVRDQGKGIRPEQIPFIFDRFYQADDASMRAGEGSGIGLTLTKELVELMGGTITVKSEPDKGSEFTITLPITRRADPGPVGPDKATITSPTWINLAESQTPPPGQVGDQELPLLLIIEDNSDVATYLRQALGDRYNILFAKDGESGCRTGDSTYSRCDYQRHYDARHGWLCCVSHTQARRTHLSYTYHSAHGACRYGFAFGGSWRRCRCLFGKALFQGGTVDSIAEIARTSMDTAAALCATNPCCGSHQQSQYSSFSG
jgi:signal transduction histidine kinase